MGTMTELHASNQQGYVVGFLFDRWGSVALIEKNRPAWQAGKINGIGGKIEPNEGALRAMTREFKEETGVDWNIWKQFAYLVSPRSYIHVFKGLTDSKTLHSVQTMEDERVFIHNTYAELVPKNAVPNLHWLIPFALNVDNEFARVTYP
jgi:8-oxo-dGTP diphosphatase